MANEEQPDQYEGKSIRYRMQQERLKRVNSMKARPRVRVLPRDDKVRKSISHYPTGIKFPAEGSVEWPHDTFTKKRIRDGSVKVDERSGEERDSSKAARAATRQALPEKQS